MVTQSTNVTQARRGARLSLRVSIIIAILTIAGTAWLWMGGRAPVAVYELKADLSAFQVLSASDVVISTAVPDKSGRPFAENVIGKYITKDIKAGDPIFQDDLGPEVSSVGLSGETVIVGVPASSAQAMGGRIKAGSRVQVASLDNPDQFYELVLLSVDSAIQSSENPYVLVMAVPDNEPVRWIV